MSQRHFKDDEVMGKIVLIDGDEWEVIDVWVDIGRSDQDPRMVTLECWIDPDEERFETKADLLSRIESGEWPLSA